MSRQTIKSKGKMQRAFCTVFHPYSACSIKYWWFRDKLSIDSICKTPMKEQRHKKVNRIAGLHLQSAVTVGNIGNDRPIDTTRMDVVQSVNGVTVIRIGLDGFFRRPLFSVHL